MYPKVKMGLKETVAEMTDLLHLLLHDLAKATRGNKTAAQRVRTGTVRLSKISKIYRRESLALERPPKQKKKKTTKKKR